MRDEHGRFKKGYRSHPETEFHKGEHWREKKPFWERDWLYTEYIEKFRSAKEIAEQFEVTEGAILFWLRKHKIKAREMSEIRAKKHWGLCGEQNGMYGRNGKENPHWLGGITPDRQAFYESEEWKRVCSYIWERDKATCQKCGGKDIKMHIHHIVSFAVKELRSEPTNLIILCYKCHRWVHSKKNTEKEFIDG
jgi:hypothetical protein